MKRLFQSMAFWAALSLPVGAVASSVVAIDGDSQCAANCVEVVQLKSGSLGIFVKDASGSVVDIKTVELPEGAVKVAGPVKPDRVQLDSSVSASSSTDVVIQVYRYETRTETVIITVYLRYDGAGNLVSVQSTTVRVPKQQER